MRPQKPNNSRKNLTPPGDNGKRRTPTSNPHKGSRVEPSFVQDRKIGERIRAARKRSK